MVTPEYYFLGEAIPANAVGDRPERVVNLDTEIKYHLVRCHDPRAPQRSLAHSPARLRDINLVIRRSISAAHTRYGGPT